MPRHATGGLLVEQHGFLAARRPRHRGSGGIGAELSSRLAEAGARVAVHYGSNCDGAERVVSAIAAAGGEAAAFAADLREPDAPESLVEAV